MNPTTPDKLAGCLIDPPVSVPVATSERPAAIAAAEPLEDPPGTYFLFQGFKVAPKSEFSPLAPCAQASQFVLPIVIPPALSILSTAVAEYSGMKPSRSFEAAVVLIPFVKNKSLCAIVAPKRGKSLMTDSPPTKINLSISFAFS